MNQSKQHTYIDTTYVCCFDWFNRFNTQYYQGDSHQTQVYLENGHY